MVHLTILRTDTQKQQYYMISFQVLRNVIYATSAVDISPYPSVTAIMNATTAWNAIQNLGFVFLLLVSTTVETNWLIH